MRGLPPRTFESADGRTADPSATHRFGRDDTSVWGLRFVMRDSGGPRGAPQIPRLRSDDKGSVAFSVEVGFWMRGTAGPSTALPRISCGIWWRLMHFMRPSLRKGAHVNLSSAPWQEIRIRSGRDDTSVWGLRFVMGDSAGPRGALQIPRLRSG
jgi:LPS sulfotransferase NodH